MLSNTWDYNDQYFIFVCVLFSPWNNNIPALAWFFNPTYANTDQYLRTKPISQNKKVGTNLMKKILQ